MTVKSDATMAEMNITRVGCQGYFPCSWCKIPENLKWAPPCAIKMCHQPWFSPCAINWSPSNARYWLQQYWITPEINLRCGHRWWMMISLKLWPDQYNPRLDWEKHWSPLSMQRTPEDVTHHLAPLRGFLRIFIARVCLKTAKYQRI